MSPKEILEYWSIWYPGDGIPREDIWPGNEDIGHVVLLPGGEAGVLKLWWHAEDHQDWRWQVEFYNTIQG